MKNPFLYSHAFKKSIVLLFCSLFLSILHTLTSVAQIQTNVPALKDVYAKDFYIGCLLSYNAIGFTTDPEYTPGSVYDLNGGYLIKYHMNSIGPGNYMKPIYTVNITGSTSAYNAATTQAAKDSINIHPIIQFNSSLIAQFNWAKRQGFVLRGHTLVWHNQTPGTAFFRTGYSSTTAYLTKDVMTQRMENYIKEVIRLIHEGWPGMMLALDVVNEAMNDNGTDRSSGSEWYTTFGDNSYIMKAFEFARKYTVQYGESQIKLYYNDYNTSTASKADGIVRVCGPIFRAGLLDGIGMQEHDQITSPTAAQWIASYNKFDTICTEMNVTELDVSSTYSQLTSQANQFGMLFKCFLDRSYRSGRGKIKIVAKDGLNDAHTFNANSSLWDSTDQCKPSFYEVVNVGINYNRLDSLITFANTLNKNNYSTAKWGDFTAALNSAITIKNQNFSYTSPADTALGSAVNRLKAAIDILTDVKTTAGNTINSFVLNQNYPNPFNPTTVIKYQVPVTSTMSLTVYNLLGQHVATLFEGVRQEGSYEAIFHANTLTSGVYIYKLQAATFTSIKKMLLLK